MQHYYRFLTKWRTIQKLKSEKFTLIFSPHIDDAYLSLYSTIRSGSLGRNIVCANVFFLSDSTVNTSKSTDFSALATVSINRLKEELSFADHLRRHRINYLPIFMGFNAEEVDLYYQFIATRGARHLPTQVLRNGASDLIRSFALQRANRIKLHESIDAVIKNFGVGLKQILLPIGIGGSLDHIMVRHTLSRLSEKHRIGLYADIPYIYQYGYDSTAKLSQMVPFNFRKIQSTSFDPSEKEKLFKELYASQYEAGISSAFRSIAKGTGEAIFWNK